MANVFLRPYDYHPRCEILLDDKVVGHTILNLDTDSEIINIRKEYVKRPMFGGVENEGYITMPEMDRALTKTAIRFMTDNRIVPGRGK